jgi:hypothetical protein
MTVFPMPRIEACGRLLVVRDDDIPGGTKRRVIGGILRGGTEFAYASPACGYAQVALAYACAAAGLRSTIFVAKRKVLHPRTREAMNAGAAIVPVPNGYLTVVQARARAYCASTPGAVLLPFGFDTPEFLDAMTAVAKTVSIVPTEVWVAAGSGTLARALGAAWPTAQINAVRVGRPPDVGRARLWEAPEHFEDEARMRPPFPSCANFDAKVWRFACANASSGALIWNVAS